MSFARSAGEHLKTQSGPSQRVGRSVPDIFISGDVETDGPIPGEFSMLSFALALVGSFDGEKFRSVPTGQETFYVELKPISHRFQPEALEVNGLDRDWLAHHGEDPASAMNQAHSWVRRVSSNGSPVFVGYPAPFDWMWMFWYFTKFAEEGSPFGFARCFDIKTLIAITGGTSFDEAKPRTLPANLRATRPHTHHALDDAVSQGEMFARLFAENQSRLSQPK